MKPDEQADEAAGSLIRCYDKLSELAVVIRTVEGDVRVIRPQGDVDRLVRMLRMALLLLETPIGGRVH
jgi:hypothetical protein